jgi:uncharacterized protein
MIGCAAAEMLDIYIDADACPVKEDTFRVAKRYGLKVMVVSRVPIHLPIADWILPVVAGDGFDRVDDWIVEHIGEKDIAVTGDILLADRCIQRSAHVIDPRGRVFDAENISEALSMRELLSDLRQRGEIGLGPPKMGKKHKSNYLSALDEMIHRIKRS